MLLYLVAGGMQEGNSHASSLLPSLSFLNK
jgi:hypothetical protein